jgi:GDP-D-mannose dehydratase
MDIINQEYIGDKINLQSLFSVALKTQNVLQKPIYTGNQKTNNNQNSKIIVSQNKKSYRPNNSYMLLGNQNKIFYN